jgi:hypothetical protein
MDAQIEALKTKHAKLEQQITDLERAPGSDDIAIHQLKKEKLRVKDEILRLTAHA